jgi:hypothetical protein
MAQPHLYKFIITRRWRGLKFIEIRDNENTKRDLRKIFIGNPKFICLNNKISRKTKHSEQMMKNFFESNFPNTSSFENDF